MEKDTDMENDIELQKFIMLSQGIGTLLYSTKKMGLYKEKETFYFFKKKFVQKT